MAFFPMDDSPSVEKLHALVGPGMVVEPDPAGDPVRMG